MNSPQRGTAEIGCVRKTVDGITYELDPRELIDRAILEQGCFEPSTVAALQRLCTPGSIVFDIGANIGSHTFVLAKCVGPTGVVVAFEPTTYAFMRLYKNMLLNEFTNLRIERLALSEQSGIAEFAFNASWRLDNEVKSAVSETMPVMTLDEYVRRFKVPRVDLIKLDVDGFELKILRGGLGTIRTYGPVLVTELCEYTLAQHGESVHQLLDLLLVMGYQFYSESTFEHLNDSAAIASSVPTGSSINVVAIRPV